MLKTFSTLGRQPCALGVLVKHLDILSTQGRATAIPGSNCHQNCHQNCQQNQTYSALSEASIGTEAEASLLGEGSVIRLPSQQARSVDEFNEEGQKGPVLNLNTTSFAPLSRGSCLLQSGNTQVLATVDLGPSPERFQRSQAPPEPLQVTYHKRAAASGRFPSFRGADNDEEDAVSTLVEEAIGPQIPAGFNRIVKAGVTLLSVDDKADVMPFVLNAVSAALSSSRIPWAGPIAAARVAIQGTDLMATPTSDMIESSAAAVLLTASRDGVVTVRMQGLPIPENVLMRAIELARREACSLLPQISAVAAAEPGKVSFGVDGADPAACQRVFDLGTSMVDSVLQDPMLLSWQLPDQLATAKAELFSKIQQMGLFRFEASRVPGSGAVSQNDLAYAWDDLLASRVRDMVLKQNLRVGGRGLVDAREVLHQPNLLKSPHGSALSKQGSSQALSTSTCGSGLGGNKAQRLPKQLLVSLTASSKDRLHTRYKGQSKREKTAAAFLEQALLPLLPPADDMPFPLRIDTDLLATDGASEDVAFNSAALALQDTNISLHAPVVGASVSLISDARGRQLRFSIDEAELGRTAPAIRFWEILTDPQEIEESVEDMHLSVAGTQQGLVALQLTSKLPGLPMEVVQAAVSQARRAQQEALPAMERLCKKRPNGPKFGSCKVAKEQFPTLLGFGKESMRVLEEETGTKTVLNQDTGVLHYLSPNPDSFAKAEARIARSLGQDLREGDVHPAKVVSMTDYGVFVELPNGRQALVHISELSHDKVGRVQDITDVGQEIEVKFLGHDRRGFIKLSRKACLPSQSEHADVPEAPGTPPSVSSPHKTSGQGRRPKLGSDRDPGLPPLKERQWYSGTVAGRTKTGELIVRVSFGRTMLASGAASKDSLSDGDEVTAIYLGEGKGRLRSL